MCRNTRAGGHACSRLPGRGVVDPAPIRAIIEQCDIPVIGEGGLGSAKHVALAMELGAAATPVNTVLGRAGNPLKMAAAVRHATAAGRPAHESVPVAREALAA